MQTTTPSPRPTRRPRANRTPILTAAVAATVLGLSGQHAGAALTHRYSFDGNVNDSVGTANGTIGGTDATAYSNGSIVFTGSAGAAGNYVLLPAGVVPNTLNASTTIEVFGNYQDSGFWPRIFDFGSGQAVNFFLTPRSGGEEVRARIKTTQTNAETGPVAFGAVQYGVDQTYTVVLDGAAKTLTLYRNGGLMGSAPITSSLDALAQTQNYIGKSQYPDANLKGTMDEFRIYDNALAQRQVIINHVLGPNNMSLSGTNSLTATGAVNWTTGTAWSSAAQPKNTEIVNIGTGGSVTISSDVGKVPFTNLSNGTLTLASGGRLFTGLDLSPGNTGTATLNLNAGGTLDTPRIFIDGGSGTNGTGSKTINFNGGTLHTGGEFLMAGTNLTTNVNADTTIDTDYGTVTWGSPMTLSASAPNALLTKTGPGTLSFPSGYAGRLAVNMGTLAVGGNLSNPADIQLGSGTIGATIQFNAGVTVAGNVVVGDNSAGGAFAITGNADATSTVPQLVLNRSITINQVLTSGNNALNIGNINDGAPGADTSLSRTLTFNNVGLVNVTGDITDPIAGIQVVKNNTGRTVLSGANTYIGNTTVNTGILQFNSPAATGDPTFGSQIVANANGVVAAGPTFTGIQNGLLARIAGTSTGGIALSADSSENLSFGGTPTLSLGAIANVTYTGTISPGGGAYRLGGGGGTLTLPTANALTGSNGLIIGGPAGGTGSVGGTGGGTVVLSGASNDYSGGTTLRANVTLSIDHLSQMGSGGLAFNGGNLQITGSTPFAYTNPVSLQGGTTLLIVDNTAGASFTGGMIPTGTTINTTLIKTGLGTATLTGTVTMNAGNVHVDGGTLVADTGTVLTTGGFGSVGRLSGETGRLIVQGNAQYSVNGDFNISDLTNTVGYLFVKDTANLTPKTLYVGKGGTAQGIAVQTGGTVASLAGPGDWRIGGGGTGSADQAAVGTYDLLGGSFSTTGNLQVGASGQGSMYTSGGTASSGSFPVIGRFPTGVGSLTVTNGSFTQSNAGTFMIVGEQGTGVVNVANNGTLTVAGPQLRLGHTNTGTGFLNLGTGGTVQARAINSAGGAAVGVLNLHGGTLKPAAANTAFVGNLTNAFVWPEGGIIDSNGFDVTIPQALIAPTGSGVASVTITDGGSNYVAHPLIKFVGGGGTGAAGVAVTDATGKVTGVQITNPGVGYTSAPTVQILGGGPVGTGLATATSTLAANASGGITKAGNGTLTLASVANSYTGATTVNAGTLSVTGSVFSSSGVTANAGGTFAAPVTQAVRALTVNAGGTAVLPTSAGGTNATALVVGDGTNATPQLAIAAGSNGGRVDIANNGLVLDVAAGGESAALATVRQAVLAAYNGGAWTGNGLTSSLISGSNRLAIGFATPADAPAALANNGTHFNGAAVDASSVLVQATIGGDSNLDRRVNFGDLLTLAKNYNKSGVNWAQGDFNYDGTVNFGDLLTLAKNYNQAMPTDPIPGASAQFEADMAAAFAAVPEPGSAGILGGVLLVASGRRRRNRRDTAN
jgi:autotransporter-associated beta strand protein